MKERVEQITELYKKLLKRDPDDSGLASYLYSDLTIDQITYIIKNSTEYLGLQSKSSFKESADSVGSSELFVMGSSPKTNEHSASLRGAGVQVMLDLNEELLDYDASWCEDFLHVPIRPDAPITEEQIDRCFSFIKRNVVENGRRVFVHSERGVSRAPTIMILFLVADKGLSFYNALRLVHTKQNLVNPSRALVPASLLEYVYGYRKRYGTDSKEVEVTIPPPVQAEPVSGSKSNKRDPNKTQMPLPPKNSVIRVTSKLFAGFDLNSDIIDDLHRMGVTTFLDLNLNPKHRDLQDSRFSNIHLPVFMDQIEVLMPMVFKSMDRYLKDGGLYLHCDDQRLVQSILDGYVKSNPDILREVKQQQSSHKKSLTKL